MIFLHIIRTLNNQGWLCLIKMSSCKLQHDRNISKRRRGHFLYYSSPPGGNRWRFDSPAGDTDLYLPQSWETHSNLEHLQLFYNVLINRTHPLHNPSQFSIMCSIFYSPGTPTLTLKWAAVAGRTPFNGNCWQDLANIRRCSCWTGHRLSQLLCTHTSVRTHTGLSVNTANITTHHMPCETC